MAGLPGWQPLTNICNQTEDFSDPCNFKSLTTLISNGMTDLIILSTLLVVVALVISGFKLVLSNGNPGALTEVKEMFTKIVIGYAIILTAWLVVYTITSVLLKTQFTILMK